ncbi:MAG: response regulator [bacterium]|nr:response regulator [bacterium]
MGNQNSDTESILLVDDNPTNLQVLFQTLEGVGCKLLIAKNGNGALTIAGKARPDLILLDIRMPDIDGYEVCRQLKADPATANIPVIFLSALGETEDYPLGIEPYEIEIPVTEINLLPGDRFLVYTDGLSERFNAAGETYGENRLPKPLADENAASPQDVVAAIMGDVEQFAGNHPPDDDQALLLGIVD